MGRPPTIGALPRGRRRPAAVPSTPLVLATGLLALALAACGSASSAPGAPANAGGAHTCGGSVAGGMTVTTAQHVMTLAVGPMEAMYSPDEAAARHPSEGEVMISGHMQMPSGGRVDHLEVHICTATGQVVSDAEPTISVSDTTLGGAPAPLPVAVMRGVTSGPEDLHYGNNFLVVPGHAYTVTVELVGDLATFHLPPA